MAKWKHPEMGEVEVNPQDAADEAALRKLGLEPVKPAKPAKEPKPTEDK